MSGTQRIRCVLIKWGTVMWNGHKVLVQGSRLVNLMCSYGVILSYVPWFKCVWTWLLCDTWAICDILVYVDVVWLICEGYLWTWISMWLVHDWEPDDMCSAECHMLYCVNNTWMSCVCTFWNVWSGYWMDDIPVIGWVMCRNVHIELHSVYLWHTHVLWNNAFIPKEYTHIIHANGIAMIL